ncbi:tyrosine-type recombinase/integrase [Lysinibacillus sphaericus]|uniref:tyrosine-type recombinase/integrase n=1 Tax=Lysinibacillus sphaericus TaxID=1421 RepID=UPI001CC0CD0E|nr:site-specific integrase [Lysinibacillus sphaericus]
MFCEKIDKHTWRCIGEGPRHPISGKRRQVTRRGKTKKEAEEKVKKGIAALKHQSTFDPEIRFAEFSDQWLNLYRLKGNKETTVKYREYCLSVLNKYLAKDKIINITTVRYQGVINDLFEKGCAYFTLRGIQNAAKMMFNYAKEIGLIEINPVDGAFVPKKKMTLEQVNGQDIARLFLESEELKEFLREVNKYPNIVYRAIIYTIAFTGMRPGEALALKQEDVDLVNKTIRINKTNFAKSDRKKDFELTPPKTIGSVRVIDIDDIVVDKIQELIDFRKSINWKEDGFVFGEQEGYPTTVKMLNRAVKRIASRTNIDKPFRTYILRHTHISLLAEAEVDLNYIMSRVGHKNSDTTTKIYLLVTGGMRENASQKMHAKFTALLDD